ncbi:hypothetical protein [Parageobacillus thermoglucosidasius]|uniref:hypothetical protein n=1 Tax=Parageobacillus thermoglucosidasius TaxID=1426 RepID=UPI0001D17D20|nr:hypothetical protein [Parageobacillus thermoglucosidasius]AEH46415.1 hypothetical protein Geoth_0372 [Parageobacillus thermoglucosidasius C56-YS93]REK56399.1 MAG: hypothetical protein C6P36_09745 [Geobacillus sp.]
MTNLIYETQDSFYQYIERVAVGTQTIADYLREDKIGEAMQLIAQFSEGIAWLTKVIVLMRKHRYYIDIDPSKINEFLMEINEGLERQDYVIVADMFEYEIQPFFEEAKEKRFKKVGN